ncbi:hypothetical protein PybrP1_000126 [[Pythium] brassicae (nom. inval.)]|nr:hypothetical protein PybrP1_000126 [[Pythium] brassicae (nom. inval.)]
MVATPILLLDPEQQRTLQNGRSGLSSSAERQNPRYSSFGGISSASSLTTPPPEPHPRFSGPRIDVRTDFRSEPRTNFTSEPRTDFRSEPRTNFTSEPRTNFTSEPRTNFTSEPRTNFTSEPRTNFTSEPRTNFTSAARQNERMLHEHVTATSGSRSTGFTNGTFSSSSSPKTDFTSHRVTTDFDPTYPEYTPMMMSDRVSDSRESESHATGGGAGYAGSSSGLRISITYILVGVALGVALGVLISSVRVSDLTAQWIALPGDLFVRALKALVIPYVFCSVAVAIGDIVFVGKVSIVGLQTFKVFAIMWVSTALLSMSVALLFRPLFRLDSAYQPTPTNAVGFTCANNQLLQMQSGPAATLACTGNATASGIAGSTAFGLVDKNNVFDKNVKTALALMTVTEQVIAMLNLIVPRNIFQTLVNGDLLSTITFAMVLGAIAGRAYFTKTRRVNYLYLMLLQLRNTFFLAMEWVIWLTPVAVVSVIAGSFAANQDAFTQLSDVYMYVVAVLCTALLQLLVTQPATIFLLTRCNPYRHMLHMTRAYLFAFATSSSLATAPVTLTCVKKARVCSQSLANFVVSIGASSNMTGMAIYLPIALVFLAESSGFGHELTPWHLVAIFLLTLLSCAGTPPIPNAGIAIAASMYKTVFGVSELPVTFSLFIAVDFLVDRIVTTCSVNDDIMALKVIAENTDETIVGDHLGERE